MSFHLRLKDELLGLLLAVQYGRGIESFLEVYPSPFANQQALEYSPEIQILREVKPITYHSVLR